MTVVPPSLHRVAEAGVAVPPLPEGATFMLAVELNVEEQTPLVTKARK